MDHALYAALTPMERNCLRLAHHTRKAEQIGHELGIKASTVNAHIYSARKKLGGIPRLSAADQLRRFEEDAHAFVGDLADGHATGDDLTLHGAPQPLSRQALPIAVAGRSAAGEPYSAEVREHQSPFVYDDVDFGSSGGQDHGRDVALRRLVMILAMAALMALVLIAAPAIYDSTAQRIANRLERPHN